MPSRGKAHTMSAEQALQVSASLAQAMNAIKPDPDLVKKMIGQPRFLQDRLQVLFQNSIPEPTAVDDKTWKLTSIAKDIAVGRGSDLFDTDVLNEPLNNGLWGKREEVGSWRTKEGVAHGYVANKEFTSVGELFRTAMNTETDAYLALKVLELGLAWDISQIMPFLCDYVWEGNNPLNLLTDGSRNYFIVFNPRTYPRDPRGRKLEPGLVSIVLVRTRGQDKWQVRGFYELGSVGFEADRVLHKGHHVYFRNDPRAQLSYNERQHYRH